MSRSKVFVVISHTLVEPAAPAGPRTPVGRWSPQERRSISGMAGFVLLLHILGWGVLVFAVAPQEYQLGSTGALGIGVGLTAYMLGVRHAFDADHIASIDNTTRKFVGEGKSSVSTGLWFSLGHSSVVFIACLLLVAGVRSVAGVVQNEDSQVAQTLGLVGTLVAGIFLLLIGVMNLASAVGIARIFRRMRSGELDEAELERHLHNRGFLARLLGGVVRRVSKPWHLYPVGFLMGLGFDTATQVALLVLAAGSAAFVLPWYAIMVLPVLFAAGMSLFDAADGVLMTRAYGWAFVKPIRKVFYNLAVTVLSVVVALVIGVLVLVGLVVEKLGLDAGPLAWVAALDLGYVGFGLVGLFVLAWAVALAAWHFGRIEQKWSDNTVHAGPAASTS